MRRKIISIPIATTVTAELLAGIAGLLPAGAKLIDAQKDFSSYSLDLLFEHESFEIVADLHPYPIASVLLKRSATGELLIVGLSN
jgi:hypothetical protein